MGSIKCRIGTAGLILCTLATFFGGHLILTGTCGVDSCFAQARGGEATIGQPPDDFELDLIAGSMAPWGQNQYLKIDSSGNVSYCLSEVDAGPIDSLFGILNDSAMNVIFDTLMAVGFFDLDSLYDSEVADGSGLSIGIQAGGMVHSVMAANADVEELARIVAVLNDLLDSLGIQIEYELLGDVSKSERGK